MSFVSATTLGSGSATPVVDPATEPAAVRHGGTAAHNAYATGLAFEQMLVSELSQQMTATIGGSDPSDPSSDTSGQGAGGSLGAYSSLLPGALSSSVMSGGGTGVAMQIAESIDPRLASGDGSR